MDIWQLFRNGSRRVGARLALGWSDACFYWSTRNKTPYIFTAILLTGLLGFSALIAIYIEGKSERRQISCLALNIYYEARGEPVQGQFAVAEVTMNRVASKHYPDSVCEVVYQQNWDVRRKRYVGMFSWTELDRKPDVRSTLWTRSLEIARAVYQDNYVAKLNGALFYHASHIKPRWARNKKPKARIGKHIFY